MASIYDFVKIREQFQAELAAVNELSRLKASLNNPIPNFVYEYQRILDSLGARKVIELTLSDFGNFCELTANQPTQVQIPDFITDAYVQIKTFNDEIISSQNPQAQITLSEDTYKKYNAVIASISSDETDTTPLKKLKKEDKNTTFDIVVGILSILIPFFFWLVEQNSAKSQQIQEARKIELMEECNKILQERNELQCKEIGLQREILDAIDSLINDMHAHE